MNIILETTIKCPNCGGEKFISTPIGTATIVDDAIVPKIEGYVLVCMGEGCGYAISDLEDLKLIEVKVFITGNSISGMRQGLVGATGVQAIKMIAEHKQFGAEKFIELENGDFVVTLAMWEAHQQGTAQIAFPDRVKLNVQQ